MEENIFGEHKAVGELLAIISASPKDIVILGHNYPDPDCLAGAVGMGYLIEKCCGKKSVISFGGGIGRAENRAMAGILDIEYVDVTELQTENYSGIIIIDSQPKAGNITVPEGLPVFGIIDHHKLSEDEISNIAASYIDIRPSFGSTSTIITGYLDDSGIELDERVATALLLGIRTDTEDLERDCSEPDLAAYLKLFPLANRQQMIQIMKPSLSPDYFSLLRKALILSRSWGDIAVVNINSVSAPDLLSELSELFLRLKGINISLACGIYNESVYFSIRTRRVKKSLLGLVKEIAGGDARAGGHGTALGGNIPGKAEELAAISVEFCERFIDACGQTENGPRLICLSD